MADAQLGSLFAPSLGGYIPAPVRRTSPWEQAVASILGQAGGQLASGAVDTLTTPDPNSVEGHGLHRAWNPGEVNQRSVTAETGRHNTAEEDLGRSGQMISLAGEKDRTDVAREGLASENARFEKQLSQSKTQADQDRALAIHVAAVHEFLGLQKGTLDANDSKSSGNLRSATADYYRSQIPLKDSQTKTSDSKLKIAEQLRKMMQNGGAGLNLDNQD